MLSKSSDESGKRSEKGKKKVIKRVLNQGWESIKREILTE